MYLDVSCDMRPNFTLRSYFLITATMSAKILGSFGAATPKYAPPLSTLMLTFNVTRVALEYSKDVGHDEIDAAFESFPMVLEFDQST